MTVHTPGAGGYGDPKKRDPKAVLRDCIEHKVSVDQAESKYGVRVIREGNQYRLA